MIPTKVHVVTDYAVGLLLIAAPYIFGFDDGSAAQWLPMILGASAIVYSLVTDYELSLARLIPMPVHLDVASGILLAASPWLFGFADRIRWPHVVVGIMEIAVPLVSARQPNRGPGRTT